MRSLRWLYFLLILCASTKIIGQQKIIQGKVYDSQDESPLIGVTVVVKGSLNGTITDVDGSFSLETEPGQTIMFSYIGYRSKEVILNNQTFLEINLELNIEELEEVVVVGYGSLKKEEVVGSISSIKSEDISKIQSPNFVEGMQGRAAGLRIGASSGTPGANANVQIRGDNSINSGTSPLWIIDGVPVYSGNGLEGSDGGATRQDPMSLINANDIASVEVLKDAAATAIYGSRGSSGVILITTKSGKQGKSSSNISIKSGITEPVKSADELGFVNTSEWFELVEQGRENSGETDRNFNPTPVLGTFRDNPVKYLTREEAMRINTDWFDELFQTGSFKEVNFSNSQGSEKLKTFFSINYREDESVLKNNEFTRITARSNVDFNLTDDWIIGTKLTFAHSKNQRVSSGSGASGGGFAQANREALPWFPIYDSSHPSGYWNPRSRMNLIATNDPSLINDEVLQYRTIGSVYTEYKLPFINGLKIRSEFSMDLIQNNSSRWMSEFLRVNDANGTTASDQAQTQTVINYNLYATYIKQWGNDHSINLVAGTESQENIRYTRKMEANNVGGVFQELGSPQNPPGTIITSESYLNGEAYIRAFFSRINYTLKGKYIVGASMRYDGVSKFLGSNRWASFPAISAGWIVSDENFMQNWRNTFSLVKLRGSFGITGNQNVDNNAFVTTYNNRANSRYGNLGAIAGGTNVVRLGNPEVTWETTESYDVGIDFGLFKNRVSGSLAYYNQRVKDLLLDAAIPPSSGVSTKNIAENIGQVNNFGWEIEARAILFDQGKFKWTTNFNITTNKTEVLSLSPELDRTNSAIILSGNRRAISGSENKIFFMAWDAGVDPYRGVNLIWELDQDYFNTTGETKKTGRKIPATLVNLQENRFYHEDKSPNPGLFGGLGSDITYGNWDFSFQFVFETGRYIYDYEMQRSTEVQRGQAVLRSDLINNTWLPGDSLAGKTNADYPMLAWNGVYPWDWDLQTEVIMDGDTLQGDWVQRNGNYKNETVNWSKYLFRADFLRLRSVSIGYTLPTTITNRLKLRKARVYMSGNNLLTYAPYYDSWDPETGGNVVPPLRSYVVGIDINF